MVYSELSHIQNLGTYRALVYSEPYQTSTMERFAKMVNGYNKFCSISFSRSLPREKRMHFFFDVKEFEA